MERCDASAFSKTSSSSPSFMSIESRIPTSESPMTGSATS
jgi:hypothetical protein